MHNLLVVDDDQKIRGLLAKFLTEHDYRVTTAANAAEARAQIACHKFDLIVLDVMMPGESGFDLTEGLRQTLDVPIILLTARDEIDDRIKGLDLGADDYVVKPFDPMELLARIRSHLRRLNTKQNSKDLFQFGDVSFQQTSGLLKRGTEEITLTSTELVLLRILCQSPGEPFSRDALSQRMGFRVSNRTIDVQITRLRRKIEDDIRHPKFIQTVRHVGYAICPDEN
jgi:two-component system, OmpR family, phosphate regulon response regulator OmpR